MKFGKRYCTSHYIETQDVDAIVPKDIHSLAQLVVEDEEKAEFPARKARHHEEQYSVDTKKLTDGRYRLQELDRLIHNIYEDKVLGKVSEDETMKLIAKYMTEQKELSTEVADLEEKFSTIRQKEEDVALFIERLKKHADVQKLIRERSHRQKRLQGYLAVKKRRSHSARMSRTQTPLSALQNSSLR